jgi:hypothetical protein
MRVRRRKYYPFLEHYMSIVTDEQFNQFIDDSMWLHRNYNEFNLEYIAIRNHMVVTTWQKDD